MSQEWSNSKARPSKKTEGKAEGKKIPGKAQLFFLVFFRVGEL
jgi:hypothetical protein